jgi:hypothetical protein
MSMTPTVYASSKIAIKRKRASLLPFAIKLFCKQALDILIGDDIIKELQPTDE